MTTLIENARTFHYDAGSVLHVGENDCSGILIIKNGILRTYMLSDEGREITLYTLGDGEVCILSASCVLENITFDVQIDAETNCEIIQISSLIFSQIMEENIYVEAFSCRLANLRFSDVMWAMQKMMFMRFDQRLASFLIDVSIKNSSDTIKMTHEQIAKHIGSAREVVSRMIKYFVKEGWVESSRGSIMIRNREQLRALTMK